MYKIELLQKINAIIIDIENEYCVPPTYEDGELHFKPMPNEINKIFNGLIEIMCKYSDEVKKPNQTIIDNYPEISLKDIEELKAMFTK